MRTKLRGKMTLLFMTFGLLLAIPAIALADNVQNDVVAGGNDTITAGGSTTVNYRIAANSGDGQTGCNAEDGSKATVTINTPSGVTATPSSLDFTSCGTNQPVVFSSNTPGTYQITVSVSDSGAGSYNVNPATFTLRVNPAPEVATSLSVANVQGLKDGTVDLSATLTKTADSSPISGQSIPFDIGGASKGSATTNSNGVATLQDVSLNGLNVGTHTIGASFAGDTSVSPKLLGSNGTGTLTIIYNFSGFFAPVDNPVTGKMNQLKAGSAIPVKFSLAGNQGLGILNPSKPSVTQIKCPAGAELDTVEETVAASNSGLSYDELSGQYNYTWKTDKAWAGKCYQLNVKLNDDTSHVADFYFTK